MPLDSILDLSFLQQPRPASVNDEMYIIVRDIKDHTRWMNAALWGGRGCGA